MISALPILLVLASIGTLPAWPYSQRWGYGPSSLLSAMVLALITIMVMHEV